MAVDLTEEQQEIRATVRELLARRSPETEVRRLMESEPGYDPAVWLQLAELGLQALAVPEEHGGVGLGQFELALVLEQMGYALLCAPFLGSAVLATSALVTAGDQEHLPALAAGERIGALGHIGDVRADGASLTGTARFVIDGGVADLLLIAADTADGPSLFAVDGDGPGVTRRRLPTLDMTRRQAEVVLDGAPGRLVGEEGGAGEVIDHALELGRLALAAECVGVAQKALEVSVEYARDREQFDRKIGSFQAVKHRCAEMLIRTEAARAAMIGACQAADEDPERLPEAATLAKLVCADAAFENASDFIHVHGGTGFTWEHPAHLYFRRAKTAQVTLGTPAQLRERLATLAVLEPRVEVAA